MVKKQVKDSAILRQARKLIESGKESCLCFAIGKAAKRRSVAQGNALIAWVMAMLGNHSFYSHWLARKDPELHSKAWNEWKESGRKGSPWREGRLAWLDWMIAECEKVEAANG